MYDEYIQKIVFIYNSSSCTKFPIESGMGPVN